MPLHTKGMPGADGIRGGEAELLTLPLLQLLVLVLAEPHYSSSAATYLEEALEGTGRSGGVCLQAS